MNTKKNKTVCIIQARLQSHRLPGKVLLHGYDKPLLLHLIERAKKSKLIDKLVIATSKESIDDTIFNICKKFKINVFRGHHTDLLDRYYKCSKKYNAEIIVRITSDCPLMDFKLVDKIIYEFKKRWEFDYVSNVHPATFPDGFDVEVFSFAALKKSFLEAKKHYEREHVTPYMWDNLKKFNLKNYFFLNNKNYQNTHRLTLDYIEDYHLIWNIYNNLYIKKKFFELNDILKFLKLNPKLLLLNKKYIRTNWYRHHIKDLKTLSKKETSVKYF